MTNYYIRNILPSGEGECVIPTMKEPVEDDFQRPSRDAHGEVYESVDTWFFRDEKDRFSNHIASLPVSAIATPELVKANGLGWVKECRVRYQYADMTALLSSSGFAHWIDCDEKYYNKTSNTCRRILLDVPEEKTVGSIVSEAMLLNELKADVVEKVLEFPAGTLWKIMSDKIYTNSIPVVLFRNLLVSIHIPFSKIEPVIIPTFKKMVSEETKESIKNKPPGYLLWENEESVKKYMAHLKNLMLDVPENERELAPSTEAGEETVTLTRKQVEDIWDECATFKGWVTESELEQRRHNYINSLFNK